MRAFSPVCRTHTHTHNKRKHTNTQVSTNVTHRKQTTKQTTNGRLARRPTEAPPNLQNMTFACRQARKCHGVPMTCARIVYAKSQSSLGFPALHSAHSYRRPQSNPPILGHMERLGGERQGGGHGSAWDVHGHRAWAG